MGCCGDLGRCGQFRKRYPHFSFANRSELADFAATLQQHVPDNLPLVVVLAGLPSIRDTQRGTTYLERAEWHVLGLLDAVATRAALAEAATASEEDLVAGLYESRWQDASP